MRFGLFWRSPLCMHYVSYVGIKKNLLGLVLRFQKIRTEKYVFYFEKYVFFPDILFPYSMYFFLMKIRLCCQIVVRPEFFPLFAWVYDNIRYGLQHIRVHFFSCDDRFNFLFNFFQPSLVVLL